MRALLAPHRRDRGALLAAASPTTAVRAWYGETTDKVVTNFGFILIAFFPLFVFVASLIYWQTDKRKEEKKKAAKSRRPRVGVGAAGSRTSSCERVYDGRNAAPDPAVLCSRFAALAPATAHAGSYHVYTCAAGGGNWATPPGPAARSRTTWSTRTAHPRVR